MAVATRTGSPPPLVEWVGVVPEILIEEPLLLVLAQVGLISPGPRAADCRLLLLCCGDLLNTRMLLVRHVCQAGAGTATIAQQEDASEGSDSINSCSPLQAVQQNARCVASERSMLHIRPRHTGSRLALQTLGLKTRRTVGVTALLEDGRGGRQALPPLFLEPEALRTFSWSFVHRWLADLRERRSVSKALAPSRYHF